MNTIPDDPQPVTLSALRETYPGWEIIERPAGVAIITAEHRSQDGRAIRYIVAASVAELAGKLETATVVEP